MLRRDFIAGLGSAVAAWPVLSRAQQGERVRRVGVLSLAATEADDPFMRKLIYEELQKLGWVEGRNLRLDYRFAVGLDRIRAAAADLVRLAPDVIFTPGGETFAAVQQETRTIPIVFTAGDVTDGRVKNIARPEGNATGFAAAFGSLGGKWLELLKEAAPNVTRVAFLRRRGGPDPYGPSVEAAARALRVQLFTIDVSNVADMRAAIESFAAEPNGGLILNRGVGPELLREFPRSAEQFACLRSLGSAPIAH